MHRILLSLLLVGCAHRGALDPLADPHAATVRYTQDVLTEVTGLTEAVHARDCPTDLTDTLDELRSVLDQAAILAVEPRVSDAQRTLALRQLALGLEKARTEAADCPPPEAPSPTLEEDDALAGLRPWSDDPLTLGFDGARSRPLRTAW